MWVGKGFDFGDLVVMVLVVRVMLVGLWAVVERRGIGSGWVDKGYDYGCLVLMVKVVMGMVVRVVGYGGEDGRW